LFVSQIVIFVAAVTFAMWGMFCSSSMRTTLGASVMTFAGALFVTAGTPAIAGLFAAILTPFFVTFSTSRALEILLPYLGVGLAATNLPATLIMSDIFLIEDDALFFFRTSAGPTGIWLPSPWPLFILLYLLIAAVLYWLSVRNVRKIANR
jgi:hypothetical protein